MSADKLIASAARGAELAAKAQVKTLKAQIKALEKDVHAANVRADVVAGLRAGERKPRSVRHTPNLHKRQATALVACSDWHVGERVRASKVNGINAYDQHEAKRRASRLADAVQWLIEHHRNSFEIREVVVWLGGDLMTGELHLDQLQSNTISTPEEVLLVQELAGGLLDQTLAIPGIESVRVPCSYGNHGRNKPKPTISTGAENSYEWLLYQQMARSYAGTRADFHVAAGEFTFLDVYKTRVRFTHGDAAKYGGGVGGIMIPINKAIAKWQTFQRADLTVMGHFHNYHSLPSLIVNGSLIGTSPYGMRVGAHEEPIQAFCLIDSKRGPCQHTPIWVK